MPYVQELLDIAPTVRSVAASFKREVKPHHWISTPNGDYGDEWCGDCGYYMVRHLRHRDRKNRMDYFLDGGWRIENDHTCWCAGCGARLDSGMTDYCAGEELAYFAENGFHSFCPEIAYDLSELIDHYHYQCDDSDGKDAATCIRLAQSFVAGKQYQDTTQPGLWADDGGRVD